MIAFALDYVNYKFCVINTVTHEVRFASMSLADAERMRQMLLEIFPEDIEFEAWWASIKNSPLSDGVLTIYPGPYKTAARHAWMQRAFRDRKVISVA